MKPLMGLLLAMIALGAVGYAVNAADAAKKGRVFELRIYHAAPGKMKALNARFRDHTCKLFEKHGMTVVGFWQPTDPEKAEKDLYYILAYPSKEAADQSWKAFRDDPEWKTVREASEKDGRLVEKVDSVYVNPTDYSPMQ